MSKTRNNRNEATCDIMSTGLKDNTKDSYGAGYDKIDWSKTASACSPEVCVSASGVAACDGCPGGSTEECVECLR